MTYGRQVAIAKRKNITDSWLRSRVRMMSNDQVELAIAIVQNENVTDITILDLIRKGVSNANIFLAIAEVTHSEEITFEIKKILEENRFKWNSDEWECVKVAIINALDWDRHSDLICFLYDLRFINTPGQRGGYDGGFYYDDIDDEDYWDLD